jgi:hypothetical protein
MRVTKTERFAMLTIKKHLTASATSLMLGTLVGSSAVVQSANAERLDAAREQAISHCMLMQNRDSHDGYEGSKGGGLQWHYQACMVEHGQRP